MQSDTVLVVGAECAERSVLQDVITTKGYVLQEAQSFEGAKDALDKNADTISAIFLKKHDDTPYAFDFLRTVKRHESLRYVPVIVTADESELTHIEEGARLGAFSYLLMPFNDRLVAAVLKSALRFRRSIDVLLEQVDDFGHGLDHMNEAHFTFRSPSEVRAIATLIAQMTPEPSRIMVGLVELMLNAIEHGNLGIDYAQKTQLLKDGQLDEEIQRRLALPEKSGLFASLEVHRHPDHLTIKITDQGEGFDWQKYTKVDHERLVHPNGRGIAIATQSSFDQVTYMGKGNIVEIQISLK